MSMSWVGVRYRRISLPDIMKAMRLWLDERQFEPKTFEYVISGLGVLARLEFPGNAEADHPWLPHIDAPRHYTPCRSRCSRSVRRSRSGPMSHIPGRCRRQSPNRDQAGASWRSTPRLPRASPPPS